MRVLIVDDEAPARDRLHRLLAQEADISRVMHARDGVEALALVASEQPDVLFLDVQMPELSGIEVAASLPCPAPLVVFATAYDAYAVRAFDANAVDYLLKPFDRERLQRTLARVRERLAGRQGRQALPPGLAGGLAAGGIRQLLVSERGATRVVRVEQIGWLETADNYVMLHLVDDATAGRSRAEGCPGVPSAPAPLLRQTLTALLGQLGPAFVRCHRRAAVQTGFIEAILPLDKGDAELLLRGGMRVPCSRQYRQDVMVALQAQDRVPAGPEVAYLPLPDPVAGDVRPNADDSTQ